VRSFAAAGCLALAALAAPPADRPVEFNRDIRPILADRCFACHGPDANRRLSKLRFDVEEAAFADLGGRRAIVPGDPAKSEMIRRITSADPAVRMPLAAAGHPLTDTQVALIRRWIEQGARWQKHWSLLTPRRPPLPEVRRRQWPRNGIDWFVLERLEREGLEPSPEAEPAALLRRLTLDLTGLPPTPAEVDGFLRDPSPDAYEKVVDRLLASPRYGERMAIRWLDAARYADTNGYQSDAERHMWRWRDWVIDAFNRNLPFDRFTVEQIAGDMLPNATREQRIATGFNRNHRGNGEGGIIPEEYAVEYVADRVETTATVWLGLTLGCARCHDHKYDPLTQKEFYQVFAYFNNVPEKGRANKYGNSPPVVQAPTREQQERLAELERDLAAAERHFSALQPELQAAQRAWEKSLAASLPLDWSVSDDLLIHYPLDGDAAPWVAPQRSGKTVTGGWQQGEPEYGPGKLGQGAQFDGRRFLDGGDAANFGFYDQFTLAAWIHPTAASGAVLTRTQDLPEGDGWGLLLKDGKVQLNLVQRWLDDALRVETADALPLNRWSHVLVSYDASRVAGGVRFYVNGRAQKLKPLLDELNQPFTVKEPLRIGAGGGPENRFRGWIDEVRVYRRALSPEEAAVVAFADSINAIAALSAGARLPAQTDKLRWCYLERFAPEPWRQTWQKLVHLRRERARFLESLPTVMVMQEQETPRDTFLLIRGAYDKPGPKVAPGVPAALPSLPPGALNNRLGFARWLVAPSNPLTARVAVNRSWQMYFGAGLVRTVEDFGSQGDQPSHPELLDWLATEFLGLGWDLKALQKTIVLSASYRQSSRLTPALQQKDPENALLARGPRFRLSPEMVRDQALAAAGLLVEKVGGPSVKPYQPAGLWKELSGGEDYKQDHGENLYRRSLYTFWKRASPPPSMMTFDSAGREACVVREARTNTPLQALTLMNDVTYLEAARALAQRMLSEGGDTPESRIAFAFRLATSRAPTLPERQVLLGSFHNYLDRYRTDPEAARKLLSQGEWKHNPELDAGELAAYAGVGSLILNLDETITKQ